ncbi:MAG: ABC transporter permease subunit [Planctomycetaceae bacterium]|nr:ABC transporter permease subunit [Planctomycetaceae bacterium]
MAAGPIFNREAMTAPRRLRQFLMRSALVAGLLVLFYSIRQATVGFQDIRLAGDVAAFSNTTFQLFAMLQMTLAVFFATLFTAANIAQEKDRKTLILLLMTDMSNFELAVGKLLASLLSVAVLVATAIPVFCSLRLLGGVTWGQIIWTEVLVVAVALAAGSWGGLVAFWREKTFQTLAISVLGVVLFVATAEAVAAAVGPGSAVGTVAGYLSPPRALMQLLNPLRNQYSGTVQVSAAPAVISMLALAGMLTAVSVKMLRKWNPSLAVRESAMAAGGDSSKGARSVKPRVHRSVWDNPVIWREMKTRAYGRRIFWIKLAYVVISIAVMFVAASGTSSRQAAVLGMLSPPAFVFVGVGIMSLLLMNAQAVTSITNERDGRTLEILLVSDLSPKEFMIGKVGGALWNAREMILLPLLILLWMTFGNRSLTPEHCVYVTVTWLVLCLFSVTLGLHGGMTYENSRSAIGNSLGTVFFLFVGIFIFMLLLVEARSSFAIQLQSFILFIGFGSLALYVSLTHRSPSGALLVASALLPFLTFYAITEFLLGGSLGVGVAICAAYGFAVVAMLVPSFSDFDIVLGRNSPGAG